MKEISVSLWEVTKEECKKLPSNMRILEFDPYFSIHLIRSAGKIAKNIDSYTVYLCFENPAKYLEVSK